jgi:hypothetical protein
MFFKQLAVCGLCSPDLADGIPRPARWSRTTLPKHLPSSDVEKLFATCGVTSAAGLRDRAVLLLLARLGQTAQVIEELLSMAGDFRQAINRNEDLGLNAEEVAFYDALAERPEVLKTMGDKTLKKLATELTEQLRQSTSVDWGPSALLAE